MPLSGVLERFFNYWDSLPKVADGLLPVKFDMLPSELHGVMPRITLLKRVHRYQVNVCLMRTNSDKTWHTPFVGMNAFDLTAVSMRENSAKLYAAILDHPAGVLLTEKLPHASECAVSLYLPLADTSGHHSYIAGCSLYDNCAEYSKINGRILPDHEQIISVSFINIGAGIPDVQFDNHTDHQPTESEQRSHWWSRFMFANPHAHKINRSDADSQTSRWEITADTAATDQNTNISH